MRTAAIITALVFVSAAPAVEKPHSYPASVTSLQELVRMSECQLLDLYRRAEPGQIPAGYAPGRVIPRPGSIGNDPVSRLMRCTVWQGKNFDGGSGMTNRMFGLTMAKGEVSIGHSLLDGRPSNLIEYPHSLIFRAYRDELREVAPGIFLGLMVKPDCKRSKIASYFAIDTRQGCSQCWEAK